MIIHTKRNSINLHRYASLSLSLVLNVRGGGLTADVDAANGELRRSTAFVALARAFPPPARSKRLTDRETRKDRRFLWSPTGRHLLAAGWKYADQTRTDTVFDWWLVPVDGDPSTATGAAKALRAAGIGGHIRSQDWKRNGGRVNRPCPAPTADELGCEAYAGCQ